MFDEEPVNETLLMLDVTLKVKIINASIRVNKIKKIYMIYTIHSSLISTTSKSSKQKSMEIKFNIVDF